MATVDDILEDQSRPQMLVTVDSIPDEPELVKVTPWRDGPTGGCNCGSAIKIPKSAIASVERTQMRHLCCGKSFTVVELKCHEGASLEITDVLSQLASTRESHDHSHGHSHGAEQPIGAVPRPVPVPVPPTYAAPQAVDMRPESYPGFPDLQRQLAAQAAAPGGFGGGGRPMAQMPQLPAGSIVLPPRPSP